nr:hypothetical protein [Tanacetum cinerariifolium]
MIELHETFQAWLQQQKDQVCQKIPLCYDDDDGEESSTPLRDIIISELPPCIVITPFNPPRTLLSQRTSILTLFLKRNQTNSYSLVLRTLSQTQVSPRMNDIPNEIYSNPLFDEEIISIKIDLNHLNVEYDLIESLLNQDYSIISSFKIDYLLDEFVEEIDSKNSDAAIESFSPSPILDKDSDSLMEEINLSFTPDDSMPPGIENDDYESEGDILILEELLSNDSLSLSKNESFLFDIPSSLRPPANDDEIEPNSGILTVKVVGDISEHYVPMPRLLPTQPTLASNQEKSLISYLIGALKLFSFLLKAQ